MRDIGIDVKAPTAEWDGDENCPFYGSLRLRGQVLEGTIASVGMQSTITLQRDNVRYMQTVSYTHLTLPTIYSV